uniref:Nucleosome assembly protein 1 n=1 Tax=Ganoderma boninense TaxID=34458 RepID=A0A5K1K7L0_9APHY|nr:Nucleosome assembly protein 1 [Ganoderma boninense]
MVFSPLLIAALLPLAAQAANDWSKPCFGSCSWDVTTGQGSGTVQLTGTQSGISDLTTAAGWTILDCDPNKADQDIRLVCHDTTKGCSHVTNDGAAGTIVRLPQSCASVPFALVTRHWVHQNQSIPANKRSLLIRRDGSTPKVMGTTLSTAFAKGDHASKGKVTMHLLGSSIPGAAGNFTQTPSAAGQSKRGLGSWIKKSLGDLSKVSKTLNGSAPLDFEKTVPLFDQSISCPQQGKIPGFSGEAKVSLDAKVTGTVHYGVAATGTVVPPKLDEFGLFVGLDMDLLGTLGLDTTLTGSISTGTIPLFTTGIPGLDFPGLFSIGPTFTVNAEGTATLDADITTDVDIDYQIKGAQLFFPPDGGKSSGAFTPGDSNVQLSVSPGVTSHGQVAAHLIPTLSFGINALAGEAKATINLEVDGDAAVDLSLSADAKKSTTVKGTAPAASTSSFGGCVDITSGLAVTASADADFLSIFDKSTSVNLFQKSFDLFKKCFGSSAARRTYTGRAEREALLAKRAGLSCPTSSLEKAASIAATKVAAKE